MTHTSQTKWRQTAKKPRDSGIPSLSELITLDNQIHRDELQLECLGMRKAVTRAQRREGTDTAIRYSFLVLGCCVLAGLAYLFRANALACVPLIGIVALIVRWPIFEKFRLLERISAEFRPSGMTLAAAASSTDEYLRMQGELVKKELELKLVRVDREIQQAKYGPWNPLLQSHQDDTKLLG